MAAVDVSLAAADVVEQIVPIVSVGLSVLLVAWGLSAFRHLRSALGAPVGAVSADAFSARYEALGLEGRMAVDAAINTGATEADALGAAEALGVVPWDKLRAVQATHADSAYRDMNDSSRALVDGLVDRGMSIERAVEAVEVRNEAVENAEAVARIKSRGVDLTIKLGPGWQ